MVVQDYRNFAYNVVEQKHQRRRKKSQASMACRIQEIALQ